MPGERDISPAAATLIYAALTTGDSSRVFPHFAYFGLLNVKMLTSTPPESDSLLSLAKEKKVVNTAILRFPLNFTWTQNILCM